MDWTHVNSIHCNTSKCKELLFHKKGDPTAYPMLYSISILGVTVQSNCKFSLHVKAKLHEANKCLFIEGLDGVNHRVN